MNSEEYVWDVLSANPARLSHAFGQELQAIKNKKKFHQRANECLNFVMTNFNNEGVIRTVKTWLSFYKLPLEPDKLPSFEKFHNNYGHIIHQDLYRKTIASYEQPH